MMKKSIYCFLVNVLLLVATTAQAQPQPERLVLDKVVALVGDRAVLLSEVEEQYHALKAQQGGLPDDARCFILDQILTQKLLVVRAELDSVEVSDEDVETQLNARIDEIMAYMNGNREQFIAYYGKTPEEVKDGFRDDLKDQLLARRMQGDVMQKIQVTPSEVVTFFNQIPKDSLPYFNSEVEVSEIVVTPKPNKEQRQIALDLLKQIREQVITDGSDFGKLATRFSQDPGSARNGGDLGWTKRGDFVPEFEAVAYTLEAGQYSDIVKSDYGYHFIQLLERKGNRIHTRHILIKPELVQEDYVQTIVFLDSIRNLISIDSTSFPEAVERFSDENAQSKTNAGYLVNGKTGNSFFEIGDLPTEIYFAIDTMEVGEISTPIEFENQITGEKYYKLVRLNSRTEPHTANLLDDYSKIQEAALEQKKASYMEEWVRESRGKTYVRIDEIYKNCEAIQKWLGNTSSSF